MVRLASPFPNQNLRLQADAFAAVSCAIRNSPTRQPCDIVPIDSRVGVESRKFPEEYAMNIVVLLIILLLLFGGGGFYVGGPAMGGGLGGIILLVLIVLLLTGRIGGRA
jgi:hypothetical protein